MNKIYMGIDNGVTGSIAILQNNKKNIFCKTPVKKEQSYTKKKQMITRIDYEKLTNILYSIDNILNEKLKIIAIIERPMINSTRFKSSLSAIRSLEVFLILFEEYAISYQYIDSKEWQKEMLPSGFVGSSELKRVSMNIGCRLFPEFTEDIKEHEDADSLLIAEYARRKGL